MKLVAGKLMVLGSEDIGHTARVSCAFNPEPCVAVYLESQWPQGCEARAKAPSSSRAQVGPPRLEAIFPKIVFLLIFSGAEKRMRVKMTEVDCNYTLGMNMLSMLRWRAP